MTPRRVPVLLTGGPLSGVTARIPARWLTAGRVLCPSLGGRYVRTDGDELSWELDHRPPRNA